MKYISLLNPITIKYLIDNPNTKYFIINILKLILNVYILLIVINLQPIITMS